MAQRNLVVIMTVGVRHSFFSKGPHRDAETRVTALSEPPATGIHTQKQITKSQKIPSLIDWKDVEVTQLNRDDGGEMVKIGRCFVSELEVGSRILTQCARADHR